MFFQKITSRKRKSNKPTHVTQILEPKIEIIIIDFNYNYQSPITNYQLPTHCYRGSNWSILVKVLSLRNFTYCSLCAHAMYS